MVASVARAGLGLFRTCGAYLIAGVSIGLAEPPQAKFQISAYGGFNTANDSDVTLRSTGPSGTFGVQWFGHANTAPYWGARGTWWLTDFGLSNWGVAADFTHARVRADLSDPAVGGTFSHLQFTNGLISATLNGLYRMPLNDDVSLYAGAGAGVSIPFVVVSTIPTTADTQGYQVSGPVVQGLVGLDVALGHGLSFFGEYKASFSWNNVALDDGGSLETNILVHHFAIGLSYSFGAPKL